MSILLGLFFGTACIEDIKRTAQEFPDNPRDDYDNDGLSEFDGDCDDLNANIMGPSLWYADADGDGFGDPNQSIEACQDELPNDVDLTYVVNSDDCNDGDASIFPNNARYEDDDLCVLDADGDGYGDALPSVAADPGRDCDDSNALIYPGYNSEVGALCILDVDGDGYGQANAPQPYDSGTDCDDDNSDIHPDMQESCDGVDNDCNGEIDDYGGNNATRWYADADGDGYGDGELSIYACSQPPLHVLDSTDCDDSNADAYPNAPEYCDGIDTNCNGIDDDNSAQDALIWYQDGDSDGFGSTVTQSSCSQPSGYVSETGDCNDNNAAVNPDALESCNTVDDDCNGLVDEGAAVDAPTWYADLDGDGFGNAVVTEVSCSAGPGYVVANTDCDDSDSAIYPNADEYCSNGKDDDCDGLEDESDAVDPLAWYSDGDSDGYGDPQSIAYACFAPSGYVSDNTDCDDTSGFQNQDDVDLDGTSTCGGDCDDSDASQNLQDVDGDGVSSCDGDCDDSDSAVYPNADEYCSNGKDDDCDGLEDESDAVDPLAWYSDGDSDGYGDPQSIAYACFAPSGYVSDNTDCDDTSGFQNQDDVDLDGTSTCGGDCDDGDASQNLQDVDGDGVSSCDGDCDDSDADVYPNADEYCNNGKDDDCDGLEDESDAVDQVLWYSDGDSDGYGNLQDFELSCFAPSGYVADNSDCDDADNAQYPGADEYCNSEDDDCDGNIDEAGAVDALPYYPDNDGDGYGLNFVATYACSAQPGTVSDNTDCDDTTAQVRPGAAEFCNNRDDDCDGDLDEDAADAITFYVDADNDGRGSSSETLLDCPDLSGVPTAPAGYSFFDDDCDDGDPSRAPNLPELCTDTVDENCDGDMTIGATDVTVSYADSDGDGQGNPLYTVSVCNVPFGYVTNSDDCNDTDSDVLLGMPVDWEICNGKLDRCEDDNGSLTPSDLELDDDGDGYVDCALDVDPLQWSDLSAGVVGGGDCEDDDIDAYPGAVEKCNGVVEDFSGDGSCVDALPVDESDDDYDGFVECVYDASTWEGDVSVVGGDDCNDDRPNAEFTYPGATGDPNVCAQDADGDGLSDCVFSSTNTVQPAPSTYFCDIGVFLSGDVGPDFVLIPAGTDPLGRYTLTRDFYLMTTEVSEAMWDAVMGSGSSTSLSAKDNVSWYDAALFANTLSALTGKAECYSCSGSYPNQTCSETVNPYECSGYVLPTDAEWEYAARSGTTSEFWTGDGPNLGGIYNTNACNGTETIEDGVGNPLLSDYAWYCGNNSPSGIKSVAQKLPNGFGLYDMHGNLREWTTDWWGCSFPQASTDPYCGSAGSYRVSRGGFWYDSPGSMRASYRDINDPTNRYDYIGFRLGLHP